MTEHAAKHNTIGIFVKIEDLEVFVAFRGYMKSVRKTLYIINETHLRKRKYLDLSNEVDEKLVKDLETSILTSRILDFIFD